MFSKKQSLLMFFSVYLSCMTLAYASLRTWSDYANSVESNDLSEHSVYVGIRGYMSSMSTNSIQNNLKNKQVRKVFHRVYCTTSNPNDKWLCGDILTAVPSTATAGYASASALIDLSNAKFSTQEMDYQLPGFSITFGKSFLMDGLHAELEVGTSSSVSNSGGLFARDEFVDISSLKGGVNLGGGPGNPGDALLGLENYRILLDSTFNAELSRSFLGFNVIYDIDISEIKPFVGFGFAYTMYTTLLNVNSSDPELNKGLFGETFTDGKSVNTQEHKFSRITYSFLAGMSYPVSNSVTAELGYKHTIGGNIDWNLVQKGEKSSSQALPVMTVKDAVFKELFLGLKYHF